MQYFHRIYWVCIWMVLLTILAYANGPTEEQMPPESSDATFNAGIGFVFRTPIYRGQDADGLPIPLVYYQKGPFFFRGNSIAYEFYENEGFSLKGVAEWMFRGYDDDDSRHLNGMDDRDGSIEGGLAVAYDDGWGITTIKLMTDLLGEHDGQTVTFSYTKPFVKLPWILSPTVGLAWESSNLTDYYYGVEPDEATPARPAYSIGDVWYPYVALTTNYYFNKKWSSMLSVRYDWLADDVSDSPIVNKDYQVRVMGGVMYSF